LKLVRWSELEFEGKLDRARAANLIEGVETAIRAAGAQAAREGLRRVAEQRTGQVIVRRAEVGVIEDVEELQSKAKAQLLGEMKRGVDWVRVLSPFNGQHPKEPSMTPNKGDPRRFTPLR